MRFWLTLCASLPLTLPQAVWLRLRAPRLPAALANADMGRAGDTHGEPALRLTVVGESTAVGVGCEAADDSITCQLAGRLSARLGGPVSWQVVGGNGVRAEQLAAMLGTRSPIAPEPARIALVLLGVNDVTGLRSRRHWHQQLVTIRRLLRARGCDHIYLAPVPPIGQFTLLPQPLRGLLGMRARMLEQERLAMAAGYDDVTALHSEFPERPELLASDGFHPGRLACALWADELSAQIHARQAQSPLSPGRAVRAGR